jgi:hypothetical protein
VALTQKLDSIRNWEIVKTQKRGKKNPMKEQPSSSDITSSQTMFKMEAKVGIKPYQGEIYVVKLNHWLQHLEVYFSVHNIDKEKKLICSTETREPCINLVGKPHEDT